MQNLVTCLGVCWGPAVCPVLISGAKVDEMEACLWLCGGRKRASEEPCSRAAWGCRVAIPSQLQTCATVTAGLVAWGTGSEVRKGVE